MSKEEEPRSQQKWHEGVEAVKEYEFRIFGQVANLRIIGGEVPAAGDPANVRPPEATNRRRVYIPLLVGMPVMVSMLVTPPQGPALNRHGAEDGKQKLRRARGVKGFMGKIPVIKTGDGKHAQQVQRRGRGHGKPAPAG